MHALHPSYTAQPGVPLALAHDLWLSNDIVLSQLVS